MRFAFVGNEGETAAECVVFGLTFPRGEAVEVEDEAAIAKLSANPTFEAVQGRGRRAAVSED